MFGFFRERCNDLEAINGMVKLPDHIPFHSAKNPKDFTDNFDCVFWAGDLNFRIDLPRDEVIQKLANNTSILEYDQLNNLRCTGKIFRNYSEMDIHFPPSYKYNLGTDDWDDVKNRTPSYCDRVLYKHLPTTRVEPVKYDSIQVIKDSDHKPVWALFNVELKPGTSEIPLSGGLFNHDIYMEGLKARYEKLEILENAIRDWDHDVDLVPDLQTEIVQVATRLITS